MFFQGLLQPSLPPRPNSDADPGASPFVSVSSTVYFCSPLCATTWMQTGENDLVVRAVFRARADMVRLVNQRTT